MAELTDGRITLRPPTPADRSALIGLRDEQFRRFIGEGSPDPQPTFCIVVDDTVVGWVDHEVGHEWLGPAEVNVGYALHPDHRGNGDATRAVELLCSHLTSDTNLRFASLAIDHDNDRSLAIAARTGFTRAADLPGSTYWRRELAPPTLTDGVVVLRRPRPEDRERLLVRDAQHERFMGPVPEDATPNPSFAITVDGVVVGWVDFDRDQRAWLDHRQVNIGYALQPDARGHGYATRAVQLLVHHLAQDTDIETATLLISPDNEWSLRLPARSGFADAGTLGDNGSRFFTRPVPPTTYGDGTVTIRPFRLGDLDRDLSAKDDLQIDWLWLEGQREDWESKSPDEQRAHARRGIETHLEDPRNGPKWSFVIDVDGVYCGHVDGDLANPYVEAGEANISYSAHPAARGKGYVTRAVRLLLRFLGDHTGARLAAIGVDERNESSLRVARAVGAIEVGRYVDDEGHRMVRHDIPITR